jgi:hypothetical protein
MIGSLVHRYVYNKRLLQVGAQFGIDVGNPGRIRSSNVPIDIVIPCAERDGDVLPYVIDSVRKFVAHPIGAIFVISPSTVELRRLCNEKDCSFVDETTLLPLTKEAIGFSVPAAGGLIDRSGWLFQQFLKWSCDQLGEHEKILIVDADTVFISQQCFESNGKMVLNTSDEYHPPYFNIHERLVGQPAICPLSFTSHHMLVQKSKLVALKCAITMRHATEWYNAILNQIDRSELSPVSEYELYGQFIFANFPHEIRLEYWSNRSLRRRNLGNMTAIVQRYGRKYKSVSFHGYNT